MLFSESTNLKSNKIINTTLTVLIILCSLSIIFPFIYLSFLNVPGAEDDLFHGFFYEDKSFFDGIFYWYQSGYNGRYANAVFMQLPGRPFMEIWFARTFPIVMICGIFCGILYLFDAVNRKDWKNNIIYSLLILAFFVAYVPDIHLFHWYSGATVYIVPAVFYLFLLGNFIKYFNKSSSFFYIVSSIILMFFIIGSHENWMIITLVTIALFFLNSILKKEAIKWHSLLILFFAVIFTAAMVFAPGTNRRLNDESTSSPNRNIKEAIKYSFIHMWKPILKWYFNIGSLLCFLGVLCMPKKTTEKLKNFIPKGILFILFLFVIYFGFFVIIFSVTNDNIKYFSRGYAPNFFVATLIILLLIYKISWHPGIVKISQKLNKNISNLLILSGFIVIFFISPNVLRAYSDIISGNARKETSENAWVQNYLKNCAEYSLKIPEFNRKTNTIMFFHVSPQKGDYWYWLTEAYFKKDVTLDHSITIEEFIKLNSPRIPFVLDSGMPDSYIYKFEKERLLSTPEKKIVIEINAKDNPVLVLTIKDGDDIKRVAFEEIIENTIYYEYDVSGIISDEIEIFVTSNDKKPVYIDYMRVYLK
ncbi:MAG: DUF6056 family protein [Bacteroidales bacterium]|jgi:hypothetical protein|nr:DUF6056 family protein [Bacteroidales bacterium]